MKTVKNDRFDEMLKSRVREETFKLDPMVEKRLKRTMERPQGKQERRKAFLYKRYTPIVLAGALALAAVVLVLIQPPTYDTNGAQLPNEQSQIAATGNIAAMTEAGAAEATCPTVDISADYSGRKLTCTAEVVNSTDQIWIVEWDAALVDATTGFVEAAQPQRLLWAEPGKKAVNTAVWLAMESEVWLTGTAQTVDIAWQYRSYAADGSMLFWIDDYQTSDDEGFEEQQALLEDAFHAGSLLISAQDWENGEGGGVELVLPQSVMAQDPNITALSYYANSKALTMYTETLESQKGTVEAVRRGETFEEQPIAEEKGSGYTARLMAADIGDEYVYFVVDRVCDEPSSKARAEWRDVFYQPILNGLEMEPIMPNEPGAAALSVLETDKNEWQDESGRWHATKVSALWPCEAVKSGDIITLEAREIVDETARDIEDEEALVYVVDE